MQRLDKLLAGTGKWSRREVKLLVKQGRVLADGAPAPSSEEKYDPETVMLTVDGENVFWRKHTWVMLNKPDGYLSATEDGKGKTVLDLLPPDLQKLELFPVGRLDKDTEGLLLLTDDGQTAHRLLSPKYHVDKVYYARVDGYLEEVDCRAFEMGMTIGDGLVCRPAGLKILTAGAQSECLVTLREGKFHQVKRMLAARGKPVIYLKRVAMGKLTLDEKLRIGEFRLLTENELNMLRGNMEDT
ncbi:MAG: pseudouridine synthase [Oscillibacter ruminantium]|uniref:pseudouridine synthase n=1 Tax=Oscillibacter ruminantium TaxID=1263547 RepID=UPI002B21E9E2|nr:pseudouridine synthase [Oscillibacter ruminantium]MEA5041049.1 pseudouridine synthase [Oscillibacter ruminantium]